MGSRGELEPFWSEGTKHMITVYAWHPWRFYHYMFFQVRTDQGHKSAGHVALMYSKGYISLNVGNLIHQRFSQDVACFGCLPKEEVYLEGLDEAAIHDWWQGFSAKIHEGSEQYSRLGTNCAYTVATALYHGLGQRSIDSSHEWNMIWSPWDAIQYAQAIKKHLGG